MRSNERNPLTASAFENSLSGSVHPCTLPDASFCLAKTSLLRGTTAIRGGAAEPALLKIGDVDARSVQKTPAGVLFARRGLFFVKRQRRCIAYFQKIRF